MFSAQFFGWKCETWIQKCKKILDIPHPHVPDSVHFVCERNSLPSTSWQSPLRLRQSSMPVVVMTYCCLLLSCRFWRFVIPNLICYRNDDKRMVEDQRWIGGKASPNLKHVWMDRRGYFEVWFNVEPNTNTLQIIMLQLRLPRSSLMHYPMTYSM